MNSRLHFCMLFMLLIYCENAHSQTMSVNYESPGNICAGSNIIVYWGASSLTLGPKTFYLNDKNMVRRIVSAGYENPVNVQIPNNLPSGEYTISVSAFINSNGGPQDTYSKPGPSFVSTGLPDVPSIANVAYCKGVSMAPLDVTGTDLKWYENASGGTGSANPPIISTETAGVTNFYVSQSNNGCEGPRGIGQVTINPPPVKPTIASNLSYCQNSTAIPLGSSVTAGSNLKWYGSNSDGTGTSAAPAIFTSASGSNTYYVSQTNFSNQTDGSGCESERAEVTVTILPTPNISLPTNQTVIVGASTEPVKFSGSVNGTSYLWSNNNTITGLTASGNSTSEIPSFMATAAGTSTIIVLPVAAGCLGTPISFMITVSGNTPDLRPYSIVENPGFTNEQTSSNISINIRNMKAGTVAAAPVIIHISKPTSESNLVLSGGSAVDWTITLAASGTHYILTSNVDIHSGPEGYKIEGVLTLSPEATAGRYNLNAFIPTGTAGEITADNANNDVTSVIYKN